MMWDLITVVFEVNTIKSITFESRGGSGSKLPEYPCVVPEQPKPVTKNGYIVGPHYSTNSSGTEYQDGMIIGQYDDNGHTDAKNDFNVTKNKWNILFKFEDNHLYYKNTSRGIKADDKIKMTFKLDKLVSIEFVSESADEVAKTTDDSANKTNDKDNKATSIQDYQLKIGNSTFYIPPLAIKGPTITIRKFAAEPYTLEDLISFGTLNHDMAVLLRACVRGKINIIVSGGTGSGKTTFLNVLSGFIPFIALSFI
jgi:ABC-type multidrug transport system fused ATPase/permease subunit